MSEQAERAWKACRLTEANAPRTFFAEGFAAGHASRDAEVAALLKKIELAPSAAEMQRRCAAILDAAADRQKAAWDKLQAERHPGPYTSWELIFRGFADEIRALPAQPASTCCATCRKSIDDVPRYCSLDCANQPVRAGRVLGEAE